MKIFKDLFTSALIVTSVLLVQFSYPGWVFGVALGVLMGVFVAGLALHYRTKKPAYLAITLAIIYLDMGVVLGLALAAVFISLGWLQGVMATVIVVVGLGLAMYDFYKTNRKQKIPKKIK